MYHELLAKATDTEVPRGVINYIADKYGVGPKSMQRVWNKRKEGSSPTEVVRSIRKRRSETSRKSVDVEEVSAALQNDSFSSRQTVRETAEATVIPKSTLHDVLNRGDMDRESNHLDPILTEKNKLYRIRWAMSFIDKGTLQFDDM